MASIYACNGYLYLSYTNAAGKREAKSLSMKDTPANRRRAKIQKRRVEAEMTVDPFAFTINQKKRRQTPLSTLVDTMLRDGYELNRSKSTLRNLKLAVDKFKRHVGDVSVDRVTDEVLAEFQRRCVAEDGDTNTGVWMRHLSPVFSYARKKRMIDVNPVTQEMRDLGKKARRIVIARDDRERLFLGARERYGSRYERQLRFLLLTGWRPDEACAMKRFWIHFEEGFLEHYNGKGKRLESFPMYDRLEELLEESRGLKPEEYVFAYRSPETLAHYFAVVVEKEGLNPLYTPYALRRTFSTNLVDAKVHPTRHQRLMGHIDYKTTQDYYTWYDIDVLRNDVEQAARGL